MRILVAVVLGLTAFAVVPASAHADPAAPLTLIAERLGDQNQIRQDGVDGASLSVVRGTSTSGDTSMPVLDFHSEVNSQSWTLNSLTISADLTPGTYTTSRLPGSAQAVLDPGSILQCGGAETGTLTVTAATYVDGLPTELAASFDVDACDTGGPAVHGEIRWHSGVPFAELSAPAQVSMPQPVPANTTADLPVVYTAIGNAPLTLGTLAMTQRAGTNYWSVASDGCSGRTLSPGGTCTVGLRFTPGYPNGAPSGPQRATLTIGDGQPGTVSVGVDATIPLLPGQPRVTVAGGFRRFTVSWWLTALATGWTATGKTRWTVVLRRPHEPDELEQVVTTPANASMELDITDVPAGVSGTFVVQGTQNGVAGAESAPISSSVANRELVYSPDSGGLQQIQLAPHAGDAWCLGCGRVQHHDLAVSADQRTIAWVSHDTQDDQSATIVLQSSDFGARSFADVSGGDAGAQHWDADPTLSADGAHVVYSHSGSSTDTATVLRIAATKSTDVRVIPNTAGLTDPAYTADGAAVVAVAHSDTSTSLVRIDLASGANTAVPGSAGLTEPSVAPDGRIAAVRSAGETSQLVVLAPHGTSWQPVAGVPDGLNWGPNWTRDGLLTFVHRDRTTGNVLEQGGNAETVDPATADAATALPAFPGVGMERALVLVDDQPDTTAPRPSLSVTQAGGVTGSDAALRWSATDPATTGKDTSGVGDFDIRYRTATATRGFSAYQSPDGWTRTTDRANAQYVAAGTEYCFSVRARDRAGNASAWTPDQCATRAADDRALRTSGARKKVTSAYSHTVTTLTARTAQANLPHVTAQQVTVLVTTCAKCGTANVYLGSRLVGRINTYSRTTHYQQLRRLPAFRTTTGTLAIRHSSAVSTPVYVDGIATTR